jgi:preprotein translocase subunit SecD
MVVALAGGCDGVAAQRTTPPPARVRLAVHRAELEAGPDLSAVSIPGRSDAVFIHGAVDLTEADVASASLVPDNEGRPAVLLRLTDDGAARLAELSRAHLGRPVAVFVDGRPVATPVIVSELSREFMITSRSAEWSEDEARRVVDGIGRRDRSASDGG